MSSHLLALPSGATLDLDNLPLQPTLEMVQACRDRIFALEARDSESPSKTPRKRVSAGLPPSSSKAMKPAQVAKEKKSVVKEIKKCITALKFHAGWDRVDREVKFSADRLSLEAAEQLLLMSRESWSSATVSANLDANDAIRALSLSPGELSGAVWRKGGAMPGRRFGAVKAIRLGSAPLVVKCLKLNYTVKSQRLAGSLVCINDTALMPSSRGRKRRGSNGLDEDSLDDCVSDDDDAYPFSLFG